MKTYLVALIAPFFCVPFVQGQTGTLAPGDNLVVQGIPKIPTSLAADVARYTEFRQATLHSWHPTRREMLIGTRFGDTAQVHLVKSPGGARTQLTFFPDSVKHAGFPPRNGDGGYFVFSKDKGGNEFYQNYRFDLASGAATLLTDGKARNSPGVWSRSGDRLAYTSTRRTGKDVDLYTVDPADPKTDRLVAKFEGGGWQPLDWSPFEKWILVMEYVSINETYLWSVNAATGEKTPITKRSGAKVAYLHARFAPNGKLYVVSDKDGEFQQLAHIHSPTGDDTILTAHIPWDVSDFAISPDGKTLAFTTNQDGLGVLRMLDLGTGKEKPAPKLPGSVGNLHWHSNSRDLGFNLVSARHPSDVFSVDVATGKVERWTESETGGLNATGFAEPRLIRWESFDGLKIPGFLYQPPAKFTGKRPVIIDIHGGPESQFRPGFLARKNYFLNELGVAIFFPNIRGSAGYGKTYLQLDNGFLRQGAYKDIGALLDWIGKQPDLDAERIMVTGGSYGGHMTLAVATLYNDRIRCSVDVVGMSNLVTFLKNTEGYRRDLRRAEYGDERDDKMRKFLEEIAPINHAHKITKPLFVIQGKNDPRVPWTESEQMVATVRKNNTPVWYLMANDEGHGFARKKNADFQFYATIAFMNEYLLGDKTGPIKK